MVTASTNAAPTLDLSLPEHHGRVPSGMRSKVNGAGNRIAKPHTIGDRLVLVVEVRVKDAGHVGTAKDGLLYVEKLAVEDLFEIEDGSARDLLAGLRQKYRAADDERNGVQPLFDRPAPVRLGWLDGSGRILSDEDFAELQGLEVPSSDEQLADAEREEGDLAAHLEVMAPKFLVALADGDSGGYDQLGVSQIGKALEHVDDLGVIFKCQQYEAANRNRKGVRAALDARAEELSQPEAE